MQDTAMLVARSSNNVTKTGRLIWKHCFVGIVNLCAGYLSARQCTVNRAEAIEKSDFPLLFLTLTL